MQRRADGLGKSLLLPVEIAANILGSCGIAGATREARKGGGAVRIDAWPIHQRGLVEVEHDGWASYLRRTSPDPGLLPAQHLGKVPLIGRAAIIEQPRLEEIDVVGLAEIGRRHHLELVAAEPRVRRALGLRPIRL